MTTIRAAILSAALLAGGLFGSPALAASLPEGACGDPSVLGFITSRFDYRAHNYLKRNLAIYEIRKMHLRRYEPFNENISSVERAYCGANATMTDGTHRQLLYVIENPWGFAGLGRNIEFCVAGLDPWYVYGAQCDSLR